jgi:hypothetical protein
MSPDPTEAARLKITYRDEVEGEVSVPHTSAGHLLNTVIFGLGLVGITAGPTAILKWADPALPPGPLMLLCAIQMIAVGCLTGTVIHRLRQNHC